MLVNLPSPHLGAPTCPFTPEVLRTKECDPTFFTSVVFHLWTCSWVHQKVWDVSFECNFLKTCEIWYKNAKFCALVIFENHICSYFCMLHSPFGVTQSWMYLFTKMIFSKFNLLPCSLRYWQVLQKKKKPERSNHQTTNNGNLGRLSKCKHGKQEITSKFKLKNNWVIKIWHKNDH